jgi:hypothetical protein
MAIDGSSQLDVIDPGYCLSDGIGHLVHSFRLGFHFKYSIRCNWHFTLVLR